MGLLWIAVFAARKLLSAWRAPYLPGAKAPQLGGTRQAEGSDHAATVCHDRASSAVALALPRCRSPLPRAREGRPLRVVRVRESGQLPGRAGRMTISGRMADVCAELDRLAAHEDLAGSP